MLLFVDPINDAPRRHPASAAATNNSYAGSPQPPRKLNQALGQPNSPSPEQLHKWHNARFRKEAFALDVNISRMNWVAREKILPTIFVDGEPLYMHSLLSEPTRPGPAHPAGGRVSTFNARSVSGRFRCGAVCGSTHNTNTACLSSICEVKCTVG